MYRLILKQSTQKPSNMQHFGGAMNRGSLSPSSSSMSESSVQSTSEFHRQQLMTKLVTENDSMDYFMRNLEMKMKGKQEELKNLLEEKASEMSSLASLKKQMRLLQDRESSLAISVTRIRDNHIVSGELESAVIQNLKAARISNEELKSKWAAIFKNYDEVMSSHKKAFLMLPWVKEKQMLTVQVETKRIFLERMKRQEEENKAKQSVLDEISERRMKAEIIKLSQLMIERRSEWNRSKELEDSRKRLEGQIEKMKREKKELEDDIYTRTQEMMRRIVNRANIKENAEIPKEKKEALASASLRERLSLKKQVLSPRGASIHLNPPPIVRLDVISDVSSSSSPVEQPLSPSLVGQSSPPPLEQSSPELSVDKAVDIRSSENMGLPVPSEPSLSAAVSLPEVSVTSSHLSLPVPLKTALKLPTSMAAENPVISSQVVPSSFARSLPHVQADVSTAPVINFTGRLQTTDEETSATRGVSGVVDQGGLNSHPDGFKRPADLPRAPEAEEPEPKKTKVDSVMPPPPKAVTRRPSKPRKAPASGESQQLKPSKKVSFESGSQNSVDSAAEEVGADDFPPPFSSPPPFTEQSAQGTPGNFDSIFGAIFSSPQTPSSSTGFQFPIGGDAQKPDSSEGQPQNAAPAQGQDFFSFFGTPSTDNSKKSYADSFFKLF